MLSTTTLKKFPDITFELLLKIQQEYGFNNTKCVLKCSPEAYIAIKDVCLAYDAEMEEHKYIKAENMKSRGKKPYEEPKNYWGSLFGIEIKLDPDLLPGEWKFE